MAALYKEIRGYIDIGRLLLLLLLRLLKLLPPLRHNERRWRRRPAAARGDRLAARHALTLLRFSLLLPASEAASHMVPFISSAYSTNLL